MTSHNSDHATRAKKSDILRIEPVQVMHVPITSFCHENIVPDRFRVVFCPAGHGALELNGTLLQWIAPFVLCLSETASITTMGSVSENNAPVTILYLHPKFLHKHLDFSNIRIKGMDVEPEVVDNRLLLRPFITEPFLMLNHIAPESAVRISELLMNCQTELTEQATGWWPCRTRSYITELLFFIAQIQEQVCSDTQNISPPAVSPDFKPVLDYVMRSYHTTITLDSLASLFATNRTSLNERFRKETGMSAIAYIIDLRLRVAAALLATTGLPVSEISGRTGFGDVTHFERTFRQKFYLTPSAYRTAHKTGNSASTVAATESAPADTSSSRLP
jgi:AraC-like DNA-binding protein